MIHVHKAFRSVTPGDRNAVFDEVARLTRSDDFARAPVMRKLLDFLIQQTIAGCGAKLKAYVVAVDGLGRDERFDPLTDSYPRVQAGRLRKMLETHYLREPAVTGCVELSVAPVGYEILVGPPHAHQADSGQRAAPPATALPAAAASLDHPSETSPSRRWRKLVAVLALACIAVAPMLWFGHAQSPAQVRAPTDDAAWIDAPVMRVRFVEGTNDRRDPATEAWILDALRRSWLTDVHVDRGVGQRDIGRRVAFDLDIVELPPVADRAMLQFRLTDMHSGALLWTGTAAAVIAADGGPSPLDLPVATLTGPTGVIAQFGLTALGNRKTTGYGCLLRVHQFFRTMDGRMRGVAQDCVNRSLVDNRSDVRILAAASLLAYNRNDRSRALGGAAFDEAKALAREAQMIDSNNTAVQFALARVAFLSGDCALGRERIDRAIALWPHSAQHWGNAGLFLFECGSPDAVDYAETAMRLQGTSSSAYQSVLVFEALDRGDIPAAARHFQYLNRSEQRTGMAHDLANTLLLAAEGRDDAAQRQWGAFARRVRLDPANRTSVYDAYRMGPRYRAIAERYLPD